MTIKELRAFIDENEFNDDDNVQLINEKKKLLFDIKLSNMDFVSEENGEKHTSLVIAKVEDSVES